MEEDEEMKFHQVEIPVALSLIQLAEQAKHPFQKYFSFWAAFNNLFALIGKRQGLTVQPDLDKNGNPKTGQRWGYTFTKVKTPKEYQQILEAVNQLEDQVKDTLITHQNIPFFVNRTPVGVAHNKDALGQLINGVLNISRTFNPQSPVWSPIDKQAHEKYLAGDMTYQAILSEQIVFMLYTIRNNLVHGGKSMGEANDVEVVEMALPMLEMVVRSFIRI